MCRCGSKICMEEEMEGQREKSSEKVGGPWVVDWRCNDAHLKENSCSWMS